VTEGLADEEEEEEEEEAEGCAEKDALDPGFDELVVVEPSSCSSLERNAVASGVG
jgi:hypothetical protein